MSIRDLTKEREKVKKESVSKEGKEENIVDPKWFYGNEYHCRICNRLFYENNSFIQHVKDLHRQSASAYECKFGRLTTKQVDFQCKICLQFVNHDPEDIQM